MSIRQMLPIGSQLRTCIVCGYPITAISRELTVHELNCLGVVEPMTDIVERLRSEFYVKYRLSPDDIARTDGGPFDLRRDAIDHRDWFFGHSSGVISCWIENAKGLRVGAVLSGHEP